LTYVTATDSAMRGVVGQARSAVIDAAGGDMDNSRFPAPRAAAVAM